MKSKNLNFNEFSWWSIFFIFILAISFACYHLITIRNIQSKQIAAIGLSINENKKQWEDIIINNREPLSFYKDLIINSGAVEILSIFLLCLFVLLILFLFGTCCFYKQKKID